MINYKYKSLLLPRAIPTKSHCLPFCANPLDQNIFSFCGSCKTRPRHATESHAAALLMLKMYLKNKKEAKTIYCSMCFKKVWMRMNKKESTIRIISCILTTSLFVLFILIHTFCYRYNNLKVIYPMKMIEWMSTM